MADAPPSAAPKRSRVVDLLVRRRVTLGFVAALAVLVLARPTWRSWTAGLLVAVSGECLRLWAAGHLEKSREVTQSGPYRLMRHPLYAGSAVIAAGVTLASNSLVVVILAAAYVGATIPAAMRAEEAFLRRTFAVEYDRWRSAPSPARRFSLARARRNREERAVTGLIVGFALLALKIGLSI